MYPVEFLVPDDASDSLTLSIETLAEGAPRAISCSIAPVGRPGRAELHVIFGMPEELPDDYALVLWEDSGPVNQAGRITLHNAFMVAFASPAHLVQEKRKWAGVQWGCPPIAIPPAVDVELFFDESNQRAGAMWAGSYQSKNGLRKAVDWAETNNMRLDVYGLGEPFLWTRDMVGGTSLVEIQDAVPYLGMPEVYNAHKILVSLPMWFSPCSRACIEAELCGCKIVTNEENGFASWERDWQNGMVKEFWNEMLAASSGAG